MAPTPWLDFCIICGALVTPHTTGGVLLCVPHSIPKQARLFHRRWGLGHAPCRRGGSSWGIKLSDWPCSAIALLTGMDTRAGAQATPPERAACVPTLYKWGFDTLGVPLMPTGLDPCRGSSSTHPPNIWTACMKYASGLFSYLCKYSPKLPYLSTQCQSMLSFTAALWILSTVYRQFFHSYHSAIVMTCMRYLYGLCINDCSITYFWDEYHYHFHSFINYVFTFFLCIIWLLCLAVLLLLWHVRFSVPLDSCIAWCPASFTYN